METDGQESPHSSAKLNLSAETAATLAVAALMAIESGIALLHPQMVYPRPELERAFLANDAMNLLVGVPALLGSVVLARRGSGAGMLLWPGALLYAVYNSLPLFFALPAAAAGTGALVLTLLGSGVAAAIVARMDGDRLRRSLSGEVHERMCGAVLSALGLLTLAHSILELTQAGLHRGAIPAAAAAVDWTDLPMGLAFLGGGLVLWRRRNLGYKTGPALLLLASLLFLGLIGYMILQPFYGGPPPGCKALAVVCILGLVVWLPFGLCLCGMRRAKRQSAA